MTTLQIGLSDLTDATRSPSGLEGVYERLVGTASWSVRSATSKVAVDNRPASMFAVRGFDTEPHAVRKVHRVAVIDTDEW